MIYNVFKMYKLYLGVYPEWFIIKRYLEGENITVNITVMSFEEGLRV